MFGKQNKPTPFFVWSKVEWSEAAPFFLRLESHMNVEGMRVLTYDHFVGAWGFLNIWGIFPFEDSTS